MALQKVVTGVIANNSVDATKIASNSILTRHIDDNQIGIDQLNVSDGSSGQALTTNGSGTLSFASVGVTGISSSADATAITIDSSENVGIGTTSPSEILTVAGHVDLINTAINFNFMETGVTDSNHRIRQNAGNLAIQTLSDDKGTATDRVIIDGGTGSLQVNPLGVANPSFSFTNDTNTGMTRPTGDTLQFVTGGSERLRINSSGHVLIGTTSDSALDGVSPGLCIGSTSSTTSGISFSNANHEWLIYNASDGKLRFYDSTDNTEFAFVDTGRRFTFGGNYAHDDYDHAAVFGKNSTPLGTVVIEDFDVSSGIGNTVLNLYLRDQDPATNAKFVVFRDGGGSVGSIIHNDDGGGVTYNTTSDYRLKENVNYTWNALPLLNQLKPAKFNFKRAPGRIVQGMLAHEVSDVVPYSVTGEKDHMMEVGIIRDSDDNILYEGVYEHFAKADQGHTWTKTGTEAYYQELDYSRLVPLLTKALQEADAKIDALTARIETLEG
tara:strand:- start:178 stop:1665 length:1488 start_codon:yes stop_codon:yes gene_type:complete